MSDFDDIRPYHDSEVRPALDRLLDDPGFIRTIGAFKFSQYPKWFRSLIAPFIKLALSKELEGVTDVTSLQHVIEKYVDKVIEDKTTGLSFSGLDQYDRDKPYLFISNHRDIVMDPAFVNYALYHHGFDTVRIAIGDNLLQKPFVSDLMRLNKSFIVKRSASGVREKMAAYTSLSSYIRHSIEEGHPIWIAQREGRAKDGIDATDPAIIKMLYMSQKKSGVSFNDYINWLHIVPVTISYQYNPCDAMIARELAVKQRTGSYTKAPGEDIESIKTGIIGNKGHVHVAFGEQLKGEFPDAESVATEIDAQMTAHYRIPASSHAAAKILGEPCDKIGKNEQLNFESRLEGRDDLERQIILDMYANPLRKLRESRRQTNPTNS